MSDADYEAARAQLAQALKDSDSYTIETAINTKEGVAKKLLTFGKIERLPDGTPYKVLAITRDITEITESLSKVRTNIMSCMKQPVHSCCKFA